MDCPRCNGKRLTKALSVDGYLFCLDCREMFATTDGSRGPRDTKTPPANPVFNPKTIFGRA